MRYSKLIRIKLGDFSSFVEFEHNYGVSDSNTYNSKKKELENEGFVCILTNVNNNINM